MDHQNTPIDMWRQERRILPTYDSADSWSQHIFGRNISLAATYNGICYRPHIPYAESLFRTCKYRPNYPSKPFASVEEARDWTLKFVQWYNHQHKHSGLKFVTPAQRHDGRDAAVLRHREQVYEAAKQQHPERWSGATRNWKLTDEVWLNPERNQAEESMQAA